MVNWYEVEVRLKNYCIINDLVAAHDADEAANLTTMKLGSVCTKILNVRRVEIKYVDG